MQSKRNVMQKKGKKMQEKMNMYERNKIKCRGVQEVIWGVQE